MRAAAAAGLAALLLAGCKAPNPAQADACRMLVPVVRSEVAAILSVVREASNAVRVTYLVRPGGPEAFIVCAFEPDPESGRQRLVGLLTEDGIASETRLIMPRRFLDRLGGFQSVP